MFRAVARINDRFDELLTPGKCESPPLTFALTRPENWSVVRNTRVPASVQYVDTRPASMPAWCLFVTFFGGRDTTSRPHAACRSRKSLQTAVKS